MPSDLATANQSLTGRLSDFVRRLRRSEEAIGYLWIAPAFLLLAVVIGYPLIYNIVLSFQDVTLRNFLQESYEFVGLSNYATVLSAPVFGQVLRNSVVFTVGCVFFQFTIGFSLALMFRQGFPLSGFYRGIILITLMVPQVVVSVLFRWLLSGDFGLINELLVGLGILEESIPWLARPQSALAGVMLANIWIGISFNTMLLAPALSAIPPSLYEVASMDGASASSKFFHITLPLMYSTIMVVLVLGIIYTFKMFGLIFAMTGGGPVNATTVLPVHAYKLSFNFLNFGQGAAVNVVLLGILLLVILVYLRQVRREDR